MKISASYGVNTGNRHNKEGEKCQDFALTAVDEVNNRALVVVADGAGSKKYALESSKCVAECIKTLFESRQLNVDSSREFLLKSINKGFADLRLPNEELGTTLMFVYICGEEFLVGHIGDGAVISDVSNSFKVFSEPENGEMLFLTFFVPTKNNDDCHFRLRRGKLNEETTFILASDGASDLLYDSKTGLAAPACGILKEWNTEMQSEECEQKIKDSLKNLFSEYSDDDQTIAVLSIIRNS